MNNMSASENNLSFEAELVQLENRIKELKDLTTKTDINIEDELDSLTKKYNKKLKQTYKNLTPWQIVEMARRPERPKANDYINNIFTDFFPLNGDRLGADDNSLIGGLAKLANKTVLVVGIEKGTTLEERIFHNFGMPNPWGYRKAIRLMELAEKLQLPVVALVDTSGAYPGLEAEEKGQGHAIASSIAKCLDLTVPMVSVIIGEGGSGGALALAAGDMTLMLEYSVYSVISPEGCASILWKDEKMAKEAAKCLCLTAKHLHSFGIIDKIIKEPLGGAHRSPLEAMDNVKSALVDSFKYLSLLSPADRKRKKLEKYFKMGRLETSSSTSKKSSK